MTFLRRYFYNLIREAVRAELLRQGNAESIRKVHSPTNTAVAQSALTDLIAKSSTETVGWHIDGSGI